MNRLIIITSSLALVCLAIVSGGFTHGGRLREANTVPTQISPPSREASQEPTGTIDGAVTPQLIPDGVAYQLFFNFFSNRDAGERGKLQAYVNQTALATINLDSLLELAAYYQQRVAPVDSQAQATRDRSLTMQSAMQASLQLAPLQAQKEEIVQEVIASIPQFVGADGALAIRRHIDGRVKPQTKIEAGPSMSQTNLSP